MRLNAEVKINNTVYRGVQARFKGNSSYNAALKAGYKKLPFNIKASDDQPFEGGYETLKLANNYRDPSAVRELLSYEIAGTYVPVPKCAFASVYVNDEYLGVYTATEGINREMVSRFFCDRKRGLIAGESESHVPTPPGCPKGTYSTLEYLGEDQKCYEGLYEVKNAGDWQQLIRLTRVLKDSLYVVEDVLDVHLALWMHAINNVLVNLDSYLGYFCHNYYLFLDDEGIFHPLVWDFNLAFGGFHAIRSGVDIDFAKLSPIIHERLGLDDRPLITSLLQDRVYRRTYFMMIRTILEDWFLNDRYLKEAEAMRDRIGTYIELESGTFFDRTAFEQSLHKETEQEGRDIPGIADLMDARIAYLDAHPLLQGHPMRIISWHTTPADDSLAVRVRASIEVEQARLWVRYSDCKAFTPVKLDRIPGTNEFEATLSADARTFYSELVSEKSANLWPLQAPASVLSFESSGK
jgi:hypothetical protein